MYLESNLNKIKNNFSDIYDKYQMFFKCTAHKEKIMSTTKYFHLKLLTLVFMIDMVNCMNI